VCVCVCVCVCVNHVEAIATSARQREERKKRKIAAKRLTHTGKAVQASAEHCASAADFRERALVSSTEHRGLLSSTEV
jgi:hypothetical protein